jgi:hypothetical protein
MGDHAFHVRRRLSAREAAPIGDAVDIRRSDEARMRAAALGGLLRFAPPDVLAGEIGTVPAP